MSALGSRVKMARLQAGMTQKELGRAAGCSQQTVVDIETKSTKSKFLPAIARVLKESVDWLETGEGSLAAAARLIPHYDRLGLAHSPATPVDRLFAAVDPDRPEYTVAVDAETASASGGWLRCGDVMFCCPETGAHPAWALIWQAGWPAVELVRVAVSEGRTWACPPTSGVLELRREIAVCAEREQVTSSKPGRPAPAYLVASVVGVYRPL